MRSVAKVRIGTVSAALVALGGAMLVFAAPAGASTGGGCAPNASVYGSYAIRACVGDLNGDAAAYGYLSLEAGHSPCHVTLRMGNPDGDVSGPITTTCPSGAVTHFDPFPQYIIRTQGTWRAYMSITRDGDASPNATSASPWMIV